MRARDGCRARASQKTPERGASCRQHPQVGNRHEVTQRRTLFNAYRPREFEAAGGPLPVAVWANGGCVRSDFTWAPLYETLRTATGTYAFRHLHTPGFACATAGECPVNHPAIDCFRRAHARACALLLVLTACSGDAASSSATAFEHVDDAPAGSDAAARRGLASATSPHAGGIARVQILGFNDFHGNIEPPAGSSAAVVTGRSVDGGVAPSVAAGGAAFFAAHVAALRAQNPNTIVVSAGDLIGASPLTSALFHDEPTIEAMNMIGLDINAVGNHELDDGRDELLRMQRGGCHPVDGCQDGTPFAGASFEFLSANVLSGPTSTLFPRYTIRELDGVRIAFIGVTLEATPAIVSPGGITGLTFADEAQTVNAIVPELQATGIETIVVVVHEGGLQPGLYGECQGISGAIVDIVKQLDVAVDLVISGHTHAGYNCVIDGMRVTSALSFGRLVTQIDLQVDRATQDAVKVDAVNHVITRNVTPVADVEALVTHYRELAAPLQNRQIGELRAPLTRATPPTARNTSTGESTLGDVIADAQLAATRDPARSEPHVALMNPGGVRADLDAGPVTFGEAFTVQPFGNTLVVLTLTGAQLKTLLEQQFQNGTSRVLHPSANLTYTFDYAAVPDEKIGSVQVDGLPLEPARSYRVTVNSFLASGGDGFTVLNEGTQRVGGPVDVEALAAYLTANVALAPPVLGRITRTN